MNYQFPGNIRELKSLMELAVTLSSSDEISGSDFNVSSEDPNSMIQGHEMTMKEYEMKIIKATLRNNNNDISLTAKKLDIGVSTIYRLLKMERETENP
jgi:two-component system response regulator AtoC